MTRSNMLILTVLAFIAAVIGIILGTASQQGSVFPSIPPQVTHSPSATPIAS